MITRIDFAINEVIWAKIKGHPYWPAKLRAFPSDKMALVIWFNDYRTTEVYRTQLFKLLINFDEYSKKFHQTIGLEAAAQEALMSYGSNFQKNIY